jgi:hypothetical protein
MLTTRPPKPLDTPLTRSNWISHFRKAMSHRCDENHWYSDIVVLNVSYQSSNVKSGYLKCRNWRATCVVYLDYYVNTKADS